MTHRKAVLFALMIFLISACNSKTPELTPAAAEDESNDSRTTRQLASSTKQDVHAVPSNDHNTSAINPPSADDVLFSIYRREGGGASSYEVDYGSWVTYWYGYQFVFKEKRYFTGFAYKTAEKITDEEKEASAGQDSTVAISQATYELAGPPDKTLWTLLETDGFIGEFGSYGKSVDVDETREPLTYEAQDGRMLLAVPTSAFATGVASMGFALFVFDPNEIDKLRDEYWAYVGNIVTGQDNEAACDAGNVMPCVSNTGTLTFQKQDGSKLPSLHVAMSGTTIAAPGKTRVLGPSDAMIYTYNKERASYAP